MTTKRCTICQCKLDTGDRLASDCGGDCLKCMALVGEDPDCIPEVMFRLGFRAGPFSRLISQWPDKLRAEDEAWEHFKTAREALEPFAEALPNSTLIADNSISLDVCNHDEA